jgi:hypothetical protein
VPNSGQLRKTSGFEDWLVEMFVISASFQIIGRHNFVDGFGEMNCRGGALSEHTALIEVMSEADSV